MPRADLPEALEYRFAEPHEVEDVARIVMHSFPGLGRSLDVWHEQLADPVYGGGAETLVVGVDDGRIVASLQIHRLEQWIAGAPLPVAGVGTVTVSPTYRKRRVGGALMQAAHRLAIERGDLGAALYPFRASFYQHLGYGHAGEALQYLVPPGALPDAPERAGVEVVLSDAGYDDYLAFHNDWVRTQTGQMTRHKRVFMRFMDTPGRALFLYRSADAGRIEGYAIVTYRTDLPKRDRYLEVEELVWSTASARRGLLAWLSSMGDQWDQILLRSLPSERLGDVISEPRLPAGTAPLWLLWSPAATLMMGPMFRLLNVEKAWARRAVFSSETLSITMQVRDDLAINAGAWELRMDGSAALMTRTSATKTDVALDISTLSRLYIGSLSATEAYKSELMTFESADARLLRRLDAALAVPSPWTFERF